MTAPLQSTASASKAIDRVSYSHDAMIDLIIANPMVGTTEIAAHFGYSPSWVSRVINSDAFQARLAVRKHELIDPTITASIEEKMKAVASKSLDVVMDKLQTLNSFDQGLKALEVVSKALGYGARKEATVQNNFVVALPPKAQSAEEWMAAQRERVVSKQ